MPVQDTQENLAKCICDNCPSHAECEKGDAHNFFCSRGQSTCTFEQKGCNCSQCPISTDYSLTGNYYCNIGQAE